MDSGAIYLIYGRHNVDDGTGVFELSELDINSGFYLHGENAGDQLGWSVSTAGTYYNNDDYYDFVVGAPGTNNDTGAVYFYNGHQHVFFDDQIIIGNASDNNLSGSYGNDTITGGLGNDTITSGAGSDVFVYADDFDADNILDFEDGVDLLDFSTSTTINEFSDLSVIQSGDDVLIDAGDGNTITLDNMLVANVTDADFIF